MADTIKLVMVILIIMNFSAFNYTRKFVKYPIKTDKGNIYVNGMSDRILSSALYYINNYVDKDATILVLPEGNIINFLTDRKIDMHCFMMDRLYHDAYGEEEAMNKIRDTHCDYIFIVNYVLLDNFDYPFLYEPENSRSAEYIYNNYEIVFSTSLGDKPNQKFIILKRKDYKSSK